MAWDDLQRTFQDGAGAAALTTEKFRDTDLRMGFFRSNQDDELSFEYQMPHTWDPRDEVRPHLHVVPMANGSGNVRFTGHYYWARPNVAIPALASWTTFTVDTAFIAADQYQEKFIILPYTTAPTGTNESAVLLIALKRPGSSDAADTYDTAKDHGTVQANIGLLSADLHFRPVKLGTETEFGPV